MKSTKQFKRYPLYLTPAMPLGLFFPTVNYMPWLPWLRQLKIICDVTMVIQQCKQSQAIAEQG
jgi:hypothetical protein